MMPPTAIAHPDEVLRSVGDPMAAFGVGVLPVVDRRDPRHLEGLVTQFDLLEARQKLLEEERRSERFLTFRWLRSRDAPTASETLRDAQVGRDLGQSAPHLQA